MPIFYSSQQGEENAHQDYDFSDFFPARCDSKCSSPLAAEPRPRLVAATWFRLPKLNAELTVIALPHDWCNYGEALTAFNTEYGIKINELNPDGGSGDEMGSHKANKDNKGPQAPDVIDVGYGFGPQLISEKLVQPYKVSHLGNEFPPIPRIGWQLVWRLLWRDGSRSEQRRGQGCPQDWADLLKPEYKGQFALAGVLRASAQAQMTVFAAALYNGGSLDNTQAGLDFFKKINDAGIRPCHRQAGNRCQGRNPRHHALDYGALADKDALAGNPNIEVVYPKSGVPSLASTSKPFRLMPPTPTPPNCGWMFYSDEGQNVWLKGYCHPSATRIWLPRVRLTRLRGQGTHVRWPDCLPDHRPDQQRQEAHRRQLDDRCRRRVETCHY